MNKMNKTLAAAALLVLAGLALLGRRYKRAG